MGAARPPTIDAGKPYIDIGRRAAQIVGAEGECGERGCWVLNWAVDAAVVGNWIHGLLRPPCKVIHAYLNIHAPP